MLGGRHIVLGVSGGIAAFKAVYLARRLIERDAEIHVVMTDGATRFVGEQTFAAITGRPVVTSLFGDEMVSPHTELARWADLIVVAPATANVIGAVAHGLSDDALSATILAADVPVVMAPAMHTEMWEQPAVQRNVAALLDDGRIIVGPVEGSLAGGDVGAGRMVEPEVIVEAIGDTLHLPLAGWKVVVSAGGTREAIDPVRYVGNRSSGKMGYAIAEVAAARGAEVTLVTSAHRPVPRGVTAVAVESAADMAEAVWGAMDGADAIVLAAAVADFRPVDAADSKLSRTDGPPQVILEPTSNILTGVVEADTGAFVVGFAAETGSLERAVTKATTYGVDLLVANDVASPGSGFGTDTNAVTLIAPDGAQTPLPLMSKLDVARRLWDEVGERRA